MSSNPDSILDSVKKVLGFDSEYEAFDLDIMMFINDAFGSLLQLGVGADTGFVISDNTTLWSQYVTDLSYLGMVKSYIFMSARLAFDPPATSFGIDAFNEQRADPPQQRASDELASKLLFHHEGGRFRERGGKHHSIQVTRVVDRQDRRARREVFAAGNQVLLRRTVQEESGRGMNEVPPPSAARQQGDADPGDAGENTK